MCRGGEHLRLKFNKLPLYSAYVHPPIRKHMRGPTKEKNGPATIKAVPAVAERRATVAFAATVGSTWPDPPSPPSALYIYVDISENGI